MLAGTAGTFARIGQYSYSIYLWHVSVMLFLAERIVRLSVLLVLLGSFIIGTRRSKLIEIPTLRLRDRLSEQMFTS